MDLFSLLRCKPPQSSEQAVCIHFKTVLPTTIKHFHEGCYGRRPTKWQWSYKSCHLNTFYCFSGRLETSWSAPEIPACTQKQFISSDLQTHTHTQENTPALSVSTPPLALTRVIYRARDKMRGWAATVICRPLWQSHTHNKSTPQTLSSPQNFVCMCDKACPLIVCMQPTDSIIIKHTRIAQVKRKWGRCVTQLFLMENKFIR